MPLPFEQIAQQTLKTAGLEFLQLLLHGFHIGCQRKLAAVIKQQMIGGIDPLQIQAARTSKHPVLRIPH